MINFTKEEISLLKQIMEKGLSFEPSDDGHGAYHVFHQDKTYPWADGEDKPYYNKEGFVWIATISDCLEFLRERGYGGRIDFEKAYTRIHIFSPKLHFVDWAAYPNYKGETTLEACLKAVLAVLEEAP